ncbi:hypothetical protein BJV77DRAFT_163876 [Russula vinacea]|nr:hypothetical protein BJV77DRAFT_163876 [Russula vinacea]
MRPDTQYNVLATTFLSALSSSHSSSIPGSNSPLAGELLGEFLIERSISTSLKSFIPVQSEAGESLTAKNIQESRILFYFTRTCLTVCQATRLYAMCQIAGARSYLLAWLASLHWTAATLRQLASHTPTQTPPCSAVPSPPAVKLLESRASILRSLLPLMVLINSVLSTIVYDTASHLPNAPPQWSISGGTVVGLLRNGLKKQAALQDRLCRPTVLTDDSQ